MTDELPNGRYEWFIRLFNMVGFPVMVVTAMSVAVWYSSVFIGQKVIIPMADGHISLLEKLKTSLDEQSQALGVVMEEARTTREVVAAEAKITRESSLMEHTRESKDHEMMLRAIEQILSERKSNVHGQTGDGEGPGEGPR